jgi:MFS family permease
MNRRSAYALLAVLSAGVFLAGLELMITAVALPTIITNLVAANPDRPGETAFSELRRASWIINGYLLAYIVAMPLAGRLADVWGARRLFLWALVIFVAGSLVAGRGQTIDELIVGRVIQGIGGGFLVPVGTAAASHLFEGHARPRALGVIGALTFLGMAAGPFLGSAILGGFDIGGGLTTIGVATDSPIRAVLTPSWRWVFYLNVPIGIAALLVAWAASAGWETPRRRGGVDAVGAIIWSVALGAGLGAVTLLGSRGEPGGPDPLLVSAGLGGLAAGATLLTVVRGLRRPDPFLDPRLFGSLTFSSAALVSLLTGYSFATAIIGGAVFVDRVLYGGPAEQRFALGGLAAATALGALVSGLAIRFISLRLVTLVGLAASGGALVWMARWGPGVQLAEVAAVLSIFGFGFGMTVTPRSTAAIEVAGRARFGIASAIVTVARMIGMAIGVAVLTAYGSTTIDRLYDQLFAVPDGWKAVIPVELRDRPLRDGLVVDALERWAAGEASVILIGLFVVGGIVTLVAVPPGLALGARPRMLAADGAARPATPGGPAEPDAPDDRRPNIAL